MLREWSYTASRLPSGKVLHPLTLGVQNFVLGQSLGPRDAKSPPSGNLSVLGGCISQYIPPLGSVRIQYIFLQKISVKGTFETPILSCESVSD